MNFVKCRHRILSVLKYNARHQGTETKTEPKSSPLNISKDILEQNIVKPIQKIETKPVSEPDKVIVKLEDTEGQVETDLERIKLSFDDVPGPKTLRFIANVISGIPAIGARITNSAIQYFLTAGTQFVWGRDLGLNKWLANEYGPIVRLASPLGGDLLFISRPEYAETIFRNEERYPVRSMLDCLEMYRLKHRNYKHAGPIVLTGPEWEKLRNQIKNPLDTMIYYYCNQFNKTGDEFLLRIKNIRNRQEEMPKTFYHELCKWSLECFCSVALKSIGLVSPLGYGDSSEQARLMAAYDDTCENLRQCEIGLQLYKLFASPSYRKLIRNCDVIDNILCKYVYSAQNSLRDKMQVHESGTNSLPVDLSLTEYLLLKEGFMPEDVMTVLLDMIIIGVHATSHAATFLLYHLARKPRIQKKLYEELETVKDEITPAKLKSLKYFRACFKESLRLNPPIPVLTRVLPKDTVVHNFMIPRGTYVLYATHLASMREEYFDDPHKFEPDRWLNSEAAQDIHAFASLPFGYGPKSCLAQNLAELQTATLIHKLIKNYQIEYNYGDIKSTTKFMGMPNRPLKFRFIDRKH